jgi:hypothetical protein
MRAKKTLERMFILVKLFTMLCIIAGQQNIDVRACATEKWAEWGDGPGNRCNALGSSAREEKLSRNAQFTRINEQFGGRFQRWIVPLEWKFNNLLAGSLRYLSSTERQNHWEVCLDD